DVRQAPRAAGLPGAGRFAHLRAHQPRPIRRDRGEGRGRHARLGRVGRAMSAGLKVVRAGLFDTLQDLGRTGFMALGMPTAGAMDRIALSLANALAGNPANTAGLEIGVMGPDLLVEADSVRVALVGPLSPSLIEGPDAAS